MTPCCDACRALLAECGETLFPLYATKLLVRGWAGRFSPAERAYVRAHRSEAAGRQAAASSARMAGRRPGESMPPARPNTDYSGDKLPKQCPTRVPPEAASVARARRGRRAS